MSVAMPVHCAKYVYLLIYLFAQYFVAATHATAAPAFQWHRDYAHIAIASQHAHFYFAKFTPDQNSWADGDIDVKKIFGR